MDDWSYLVIVAHTSDNFTAQREIVSSYPFQYFFDTL